MPAMARASLDPRWTRHHTKSAEGFMLATIKAVRKITVGGNPVYDRATQTYSNIQFETVYVGKARIQPYGISGDQIVGQDLTARRLMRVQIADVTTGIQVDDMVYVTESPEAPELVQYQLDVRGAISSSNQWLTDLVCEANMKQV